MMIKSSKNLVACVCGIITCAFLFGCEVINKEQDERRFLQTSQPETEWHVSSWSEMHPELAETESGINDIKSIEYDEKGMAYINTENDDRFGPYKYVENTSKCYERFVDCETGLWGYLNPDDGKVIIEPVYSYLGNIAEDYIVVSQGDGYFYIDKNGERVFNQTFSEAMDFESQGILCRVMTADGLWNIMTRSGEIVLEGCSKINPLPDVFIHGTAVKDGHVILFVLDFVDGTGLRVLKEFDDEYIDVSEIEQDRFFIVKTKTDHYGVVNVLGDGEEMFLTPDYLSITYEKLLLDSSGTWLGDYVFVVEKEDHTFETFFWRSPVGRKTGIQFSSPVEYQRRS